MKVVFKKNWFGPGGQRFRAYNPERAVDVPEEHHDCLPKTAKVVSGDVPVKVVHGPDTLSGFTALRDLDIDRASAEAETAAHEKADKNIAEAQAPRADADETEF